MAEVLSQSQIDALLAAAQSGNLDAGAKKEEAPEKKYKKYDFYSPRKFGKDLSLIHISEPTRPST